MQADSIAVLVKQLCHLFQPDGFMVKANIERGGVIGLW
jgi:hypothetical protein